MKYRDLLLSSLLAVVMSLSVSAFAQTDKQQPPAPAQGQTTQSTSDQTQPQQPANGQPQAQQPASDQTQAQPADQEPDQTADKDKDKDSKDKKKSKQSQAGRNGLVFHGKRDSPG